MSWWQWLIVIVVAWLLLLVTFVVIAAGIGAARAAKATKKLHDEIDQDMRRLG